MKKGDEVMVYTDPLSRSNLEGQATVKAVLEQLDDHDDDGNYLYRCVVLFDGDETSDKCIRVVSDD